MDIKSTFKPSPAPDKSMEYFTLIFDQHYDAIILLESDYTCSYMNDPAKRFFGDLKNGIPAFNLFSDQENFSLFKRFVENNTNNGFLIDKIFLKGKKEDFLPSSIKGKIISFSDKEEIFCSIRDITKKIKSEEEQKELQAKLIQANKMTSLGNIASGIGHEINNPNNFILSNAQILLEIWENLFDISNQFKSPVNESEMIKGFSILELNNIVPQLLNSIIKGSNRISNIISQLRDFTRPTKLHFEKINISSSINFARSILRNQIAQKTNNFIVNIPQDLPEFYGDPRKIEQILINLCQNSLNALKSRHDSVWVSLNSSEDDNFIFLEVKDNGVGIKNEDLEKVKDPFFTTRQNFGGTGLGLYICYTIVESHKGDITISSEENIGTTVLIKFPRDPRTRKR